MSLQKKTIQKYRQTFPDEPLRQVAQRTGIQITRVFRLFNGKPMKVAELEAFDRAITEAKGQGLEQHGVIRVLEEATLVLGPADLDRIRDYVERKIYNQSFRNVYRQLRLEDASIA